MHYEAKNILLKNGVNAVFRSPEASDGKAMNSFLRTLFSETDFLMRYPEEWTQTEESESVYLENVNTSPYALMIVCTIDGEIAGNCNLMFMPNIKTKHRASAAIGILQKYWGLGIGSALFAEMFAIAKEKGILQIELDYLEGNERARGLYEKIGFVHVGEKPDAIRLKDGTLLKEYSMIRKLALTNAEEPEPLKSPDWTIIPYNEKYRDDMIFMVLEAKNALGRIPRLNDDLLDIQANYLDKGDMFWLALDANDRVIGCIGYNSIPGTTEVKLHRLYVKCDRKRQGIGTALLQAAEAHIQNQEKTTIYVHLGGKEYFESHRFYPKHGYKEYAQNMKKKELCIAGNTT